MGIACCCINIVAALEPSDWIAIIGVIVNSILAIWIVNTIQNKLTNKRVLKDHFITEIKDIRNDFRLCLNNLYQNNTNPKNIIPWFKLMNIKISDLIENIHYRYGIDKKVLNAYQNELRELITENNDFINQFQNNKLIISEDLKAKLVMFQQNNNSTFNKIIIKINDFD